MMKMENGTEDERVLQQFSLPRFEIELAQNHSTEVLQGIGCAAGIIARIDTDLGHPEG